LICVGWRITWWIVFLGAVAVAAVAIHLNRHVGNTIRTRVEAELAERFPGLKVTVRSAELVQGEGLDVRGVSIVEPSAEGPRAELAHVEEVRLTCATDLSSLISGNPEISQITIRRPTIWATRRADGSWSIGRLLPKPDNRLPLIKFENGTIEIFDPLKTPSSTLTLRDINLTIEPGTLPVAAGPCPRKFQGTLGGDHFRQIVVEGLLEPISKAWNATGTVEGLQVSPDLCAALPNPLAAKARLLASVRGEAGCTFRVSYDPAVDAEPFRFDVSGRLSRARIDDPRLPNPLSDVHAGFRCDNQGVSVPDFSARSGPTALRMKYRRNGYAADGPWLLEAEIRQLELDSRLLAALPDMFTGLWSKYLPAGCVDVDLQLAYDGHAYQPDVLVTCQNVSFTYREFPYRLEYGKGTLSLKNDLLRLALSAQSAGREVRLSGEVQHPLDASTGWMEIKGADLPLDEKLLAALHERHRSVVRTLHPQGTCDFQIKLWRARPDEIVHKQLAVMLNRCSMCCDHFPYPIYEIRGRLDMLDGQWEFSSLEGANDSGHITGSGYLHTQGDGSSDLYLKLAGISVPLEDELRDAMRPNMRQLWKDIRPHGAVNLVAEIGYQTGHNLSVSVLAEPQSETAWIEPVQFPYRLEKLEGAMSYRDGRFTIARLRAEHGHVKLSATGYCDFLPDASWRLRIENLAVDQLVPDRELTQALPNRIRKSLGGLNSSGPVNLRGWLELEHGGQQLDPIRSRWDLVIGFQGGSIDCGISLQNLCGEMTLAGGFDGQRMYSRGELSVDSATYKDVQFTQVLGPVWIDDERVLVGSWVDRDPATAPDSPEAAAARQQARPITAKLFGGTVWGDGWVVLGEAPRYGLRATLADADLARCAQEAVAGHQNLTGHVFGTLELRGAGRSIHNLGGHGNIRMRDGNVYELPLMVALLKILSIRQPDTKAFSQSDMDFRISGNHIYFDRANFAGDAISLEGTGEMNFDGQLQMTFHAIVGRGDPYVPVIQDLVGGASQQIMLIHVDGSLQDPHTRREAFPVVNKALQQLANPEGLFPPARR
jgi:hypothetical protein